MTETLANYTLSALHHLPFGRPNLDNISTFLSPFNIKIPHSEQFSPALISKGTCAQLLLPLAKVDLDSP